MNTMITEEQKLREEAEARVGFKRHLRTYIAVNILIWAFWFVTRARFGYYDGYWPAYSTLGWGFGLVSHYFGVYYRNDNAVNRELDKIKKKRGLD